jgi:hypothetical protein
MKKHVALLVLAMALGTAEPSGLGLGIVVGEPTGLSAKAWLSDNSAVDAAAAWSVGGRYQAVHVHADFLHHNFGLFEVAPGDLPLYYGIGGRIKLAGHEKNQEMRLGVRVPVGISYLFDSSRFDLFLEVVPLLDLVPSTRFGWNSGVGFRYYFH